MELLTIGVAGFIGAVCRYLLYQCERTFSTLNFPFGTLIINLTGCLLSGVLFSLSTRLATEQRHQVTLILVGFVGSYTTFSTFSMETLRLLESHSYFQALGNIGLNVIGGVMMVWMGRLLTSA